jgi:hypothetical protein
MATTNLQDQILSSIAKKMQQAIDQQILDSIMDAELICSEGTVYGKRYYTVQPVGMVNWKELEEWCVDRFGECSSIWEETKNLAPKPHQRWYANNRKFWFRDEKDRLLFVLRWS